MTGLRILFAAAGGQGHLQPLLPLALEAVERGHDVLVSAAPTLALHVVKVGLRFVASGPDLVPVRSQLLLRSLDEERRVIPDHFIGRLGPARARDLITAGDDFAADLIVCDDADYGAIIAAEVLGVPHAVVTVSAAGGLVTPDLIRPALERLRSDFALPAEDGMGMVERSLTLNPFPRRLWQPPVPPRAPPLHYCSAPVRPSARADGVRVFVTLGTIFNTESGDLLARITGAVAASHRIQEVIVATGETMDPAELGPQPDKVVAHRFVDQQVVVASCVAVVCHGGSGTVLDALRCGIPMVLLPLGADQPLNAARCESLGCALRLRADQVTGGEITAAVETILTDESFRAAAEALQTELADLPSMERAVDALEEHGSPKGACLRVGEQGTSGRR